MIKQMFQGRIGVAQYWGAVLTLLCCAIIIWLAVVVLLGTFGTALFASGQGTGGVAGILGLIVGIGFLGLVVNLVMAFIVTGLQVRRLHDLGLTGWIVLAWWLVGIVLRVFGTMPSAVPGKIVYAPWVSPIVIAGFLFWIIVTFVPSSGGPNAYGPWIRYRSWRAGLIGSKAGAAAWGGAMPPSMPPPLSDMPPAPTPPAPLTTPTMPGPSAMPASQTPVIQAPPSMPNGSNPGIFPEHYTPPPPPPPAA